jgi:hypothetical protein
MTSHNIIKNLTRRGNSILGVGCYSAAISSKNGLEAIKVGTNMEDPWLDFYELINQEHIKDNPHVPVVKSFYSDDSNYFYVCVMERLEPVTVMLTALTDMLRKFVEGSISLSEFYMLTKGYKKHIPNPEKMRELLDEIRDNTTHYSFDNDDCEDNGGRKLDLHSGNFMLRDDVLVIIDPWCNVCMQDVEDLSEWADKVVKYDSTRNT